MTNLFAYFTKPSAPVHFPGAPFLLAAILMLASTILAYSTMKNDKYQAALRPDPVLEEVL
jgi:DHA1 family tetracycline resistance protein-like MFS transporter